MLFVKKKNAPSFLDHSDKKRTRDDGSFAQSMLEYMILVGVVTIVLVALGPLFKRGIQAVVRLVADQLQTQANAEQKVTPISGYLIDQYSSASDKNLKWKTDVLGDILYNYEDSENVQSNSSSNLGFTNRYF